MSTYLIVSGAYSDFQVHCRVNGTKAEAEALCDHLNRGRVYEPYTVYEVPTLDPDAPITYLLTLQVAIREGTGSTHEMYQTYFPFQDLPEPVSWSWRSGLLTVSGTDHERVRKVFGDKRAELLADPALRAKDRG